MKSKENWRLKVDGKQLKELESEMEQELEKKHFILNCLFMYTRVSLI